MDVCHYRPICLFIFVLALVAAARPALADNPSDARSDSPVVASDDDEERADKLPEDFEPGLGPTVAAVFPGVLLRGSGLFVAGDKRGAYRLAQAEAVGLLGATLGFLSMYKSGASRRIINPLYYATLASASAFVVPWFADIYGASVGGRRADARMELAPFETRLGYAYVHDPQFDYGHFGHARAEFRLEPIRFRPEAWIALDDYNQRFRLETDWRFLGPRARPEVPGSDGSFLDLETGLTYHNFGDETFRYLVLEAGAAGRYDLRRASSTLRGSFAELSLGIASQMHGYGGARTQLGEDFTSLLLMRTAFGVYLDPGDTRYGEVELYYDHRHDTFAAGSGINSRYDGILGHVGLQGFYYPHRHWGLFGDLKVGSAYVGLAGVTFRYGGR